MSTCARSAVRRPDSTTTRPARANMLQRAAVKPACECAECAKGKAVLQRAAVTEHAPAAVPPIVYNVLRSPGEPLERGTREFMEERLGHDFGAVRVHTDAPAAESARAVNARAYTVGSHISFSAHTFAPHTLAGRHLLAHELAHVAQYGQMGSTNANIVIDAGGTHGTEREAHAAADKISNGEHFRVRTRPIGGAAYALRRAAINQLPRVGSSVARARSPLYLVPKSLQPELHAVARGAGVELRVVADAAERAASKHVEKALWKFILEVLAKRYGVMALGFTIVEWLPIVGQLLELGFAAWMVWDMLQVWDTLVEQARQLQRASQSAEATVTADRRTQSPAANIDLEGQWKIAVGEDDYSREREENCRNLRKTPAMNCYGAHSDPWTEISRFLDRKYGAGFARPGATLEPYPLKEQDMRLKEKYGIRDCERAQGKSWHVKVTRRSDNSPLPKVSVFECECCDQNGKLKSNWTVTHLSGK